MHESNITGKTIRYGIVMFSFCLLGIKHNEYKYESIKGYQKPAVLFSRTDYDRDFTPVYYVIRILNSLCASVEGMERFLLRILHMCHVH